MEAPDSAAGPAPAFLRIALLLRDRIDAGHLKPGAAVSSERELAIAFGVSRMTARQALGVLESEGVVYRHRPQGTFVARPRLAMRIGSFSDEVVRLGHRPGAEVIWAELQEPTPLVARELGLSRRAKVHSIRRLRRADEEGIAIETTYLAARTTPRLLEQPLDGSLWAILRRDCGIVPSRAVATLEVVTLDGVSARQLGVRRAAAAFLLTRRTFDADDRCVEFARDLYRADRVTFQLESPIPPPESPLA